ncbi:MAG TPA: tryptophan--tRNA ligase [Acidobacteriaceae bacterium]|jgi:tryptophanyl-tRNA synthetase|nr:tryptophan--tRNA ligase [Acidobacteriaceae bacterium]
MSATHTSSTPKRVLSGMRPTGRLHLGNYMGALRNWVELQHEKNDGGGLKYECFFFIADLHALTTEYADPSGIQQSIQDVAMDFLAAGLDETSIFVQSDVPQHSELFTLFAMFTPLSWLERVPTYKDQQEQLREKDLNTYGFLGYPLLQAADILLYRPDFVPVGQDQVAHVELTREVARKFNSHYKPGKQDVLPEPKVLVTASPKLPGTDGRKMSKSYGNTISLTEPEAEVRKKLKTMVTDPARVRRTDPGNPEVCPVGDLHKVFSSDETRLKVWEGCTTAGIGCIECKGWAADGIVAVLEPIQARRKKYEANPKLVTEILTAGAVRAKENAEATMQQVRHAMKLG